jgi:hypothetical protein
MADDLLEPNQRGAAPTIPAAAFARRDGARRTRQDVRCSAFRTVFHRAATNTSELLILNSQDIAGERATLLKVPRRDRLVSRVAVTNCAPSPRRPSRGESSSGCEGSATDPVSSKCPRRSWEHADRAIELRPGRSTQPRVIETGLKRLSIVETMVAVPASAPSGLSSRLTTLWISNSSNGLEAKERRRTCNAGGADPGTVLAVGRA